MSSDRCGPAGTHRRWALPVARIATLALTLLFALAGPVLAEEDNLPRYWEYHAALLSLATFLFVLSFLVLLARALRRTLPFLKMFKVAWLVSAHKVLGGLGAAFGVAGIGVGLYMVEMAGTGHARITHSLVGFTTLLCVIVPVITGFAVYRTKDHVKAVRWWHILLGALGIVVMLLGAATGWALE